MLKLICALPPVLLLAMMPQQPVATPGNAAPAADETTQSNPVTATPESQARARTIYGMDCALCHGDKGNGKGDLVADMHLTIKDFGDPATLKDKTDAQIFNTIKNGNDKDKMPAEGPRAKDVEIWNLVIYLRSFSK
jgi:mono/diheme cytochrome c family protein